MNENAFGNYITIVKGKKHTFVDSPSSDSNRVIQIDDLRTDNLLKYTNDNKGTHVCKNDVVIAWDGANAGTIGYGKEGFIGSTLARLRLTDLSKYDPIFIGKFLQSKYNYLRKTATGATIPHISRRALEKIILPDISFTDQKRIAKVLSHCEELIKKRKQSINLLDEFIKSTFLEMFGENNTEYKNWTIDSIENYAFSKKGSLRTGPFGSSLLHSEFKDNGKIRVLGIDNVVNDIFEWGKPRFITLEKFEELKRYRVYPGDVLISIMATNGRSAVIPDDIPASINTKHLAAITLDKTKILPYYLKCSFQYHPLILRQLSKNIKGAIMNGLNLSIIKKLKLPKPPLDLQEKFSEAIKKQLVLKLQFQESLKQLENLYGSLSQKAFKGELDLSKVELVYSEVKDVLSPEMKKMISETELLLGQLNTPKLIAENADQVAKSLELINKFQKQIENLPKLPESVIRSMNSIEKFKSSLAIKAIERSSNIVTNSHLYEVLKAAGKKQQDLNKFKSSPVLKAIENTTKLATSSTNKVLEQIAEQQKYFDKASKTHDIISRSIPHVTLKNLKAFQNKPSRKKTKLIWEDVSTQRMASLIREKYNGYHFNIKMLYRFFQEEHVITPDYYASSEMKKSPGLINKDDIKKFIFSAININGEKVENPFIKLKQEFYNSEEENFVLNLTDEDYEMAKDLDNNQRSGIYLSIIDED